MKKLLVGVVALVVLVGTFSAAFASDTIGIFEPRRILTSHPQYKSTQTRIEKMSEQKANEAKIAVDKATTPEKKQEAYEAKRREVAEENEKLMAPILKDIDAATRTVARNKKITVVMDGSMVVYGGIDITEDIVQELKRIKK